MTRPARRFAAVAGLPTSPELLLSLAVSLACATPTPTPLGAQETAIRAGLPLETYLHWERVSDGRISPDGRRIVYTRSAVDRMEDRWRSELWIMNADGSRKRFLTTGSGARWSPDGTRLAYVAEGEGGASQISVLWMDGTDGPPTQITRLEHAPSDLRWSPDGTRIAFTSQVDTPPAFRGVELPDRPEGAEWTEGPKIVERSFYRRDRRGFVDDGRRHLFVVPAEGGRARRLTDGDWDHEDPEWTADGRELVFTSLRVEEAEAPENWYESEVYAVEPASGAIRPLTTRRGPDGAAVPSPDGRWIAYTGVDWNEDAYRNRGVYVMRRDGSDPRLISGGFDRAPGELVWAPDGSGVYFDARSEGTRNLHFASLRGGVRQVTRGEHVLSLASLSRGGTAVVTVSDPHEPGDLYALEPNRPGTLRRITRVNADVLEGIALGEVEEIRYPSTDGLEIQGWIVKPPDFDPARRYPLVLAIHGGPHAMYDVGFSYAFQAHAARGYVVLYTNPRGSTGYGSAFANAIDHAYPGADVPDLLTGVDSLVARGYVDAENLFVYGCSGGGILTAEIVTRTDRFRAASSNCTIVDWISAMGTSDAVTYARSFEVPFWEDPSEWIRRSSLFRVGGVSTPTMLMVGERDLRTPVGQTEQFYQALRTLGVPTVMLRFREEWHGTGSRPSNFLRTQLYLWKWFEKWGTHDEEADGG